MAGLMRIGVDVGGTNTDAVLMEGDTVISSNKSPTTEDVSSGIIDAVKHVLTEGHAAPDEIASVMIGTTHFTNAFVEGLRLMEVGVIRLALPAGKALPPMVDWPDGLRNALGHHVFMVHGGYQFDGRENTPLNEQEVADAACAMARKGLKAIAISSVFSQVNSSQEERAAEIVQNELPDARITLSSKIGRIGLLERENAAIMNASLADLSSRVISAFRKSLTALDIKAPFFISQNDGTLMNADFVERYPVLTFASGPTNSIRGAAYLSGVKDALVVDIGGTTTDIGILSGGFPRESSEVIDIGGVRTNFRMPDIFAIGLGGGSIVRGDDKITVGPDSVGYRLLDQALVFGGKTLTASDIAVASGIAEMGDPRIVKNLDASMVARALDTIHLKIEEAVDRMKTSADPVPLVLVGGGAVLISRQLAGTSETIIPNHAGVANAIGAAIAQVGGEVDRVYSYEEMGRDKAMELAKREASEQAVAAGALEGTVNIVDVEEIPLQYVPGGAVRLRVRAVGDLKLAA